MHNNSETEHRKTLAEHYAAQREWIFFIHASMIPNQVCDTNQGIHSQTTEDSTSTHTDNLLLTIFGGDSEDCRYKLAVNIYKMPRQHDLEYQVAYCKSFNY